MQLLHGNDRTLVVYKLISSFNFNYNSKVDNVIMSQQQFTTRFTDSAPMTATTTPTPQESTFMLADTGDRIEDFLQRPILVDTFEWTPGQAAFRDFNPWRLFFFEGRVRNKLTNFYLLRCKMHLRFMVNGTPFYYGRLLASYIPLGPIDILSQQRSGNQFDLIEASQRPHVTINPSHDEVAEMELPYIYPKSALNLTQGEFKYMGNVRISDLNVLRCTNNTDPITVSVFAWATDVQYSQPTSGVIPLQGEYEDSEPAGVVSKPATTIERIAAKLATAPIIGPYAKATSMVAGGVARMASLFGFSRPRDITPSCHYSWSMMRRYAPTNIVDECDVLAIDAKKEVTVDPRVAGCDSADPMAMVPIAKRESYLTSFAWDTSVGPDTLLWQARVSPFMYDLDNGQMHMTPMCWLSVPFRYWRGSVNYRFEVVCSKFHRGRLRLMFDPIEQRRTFYNTNYQQIVDIKDGCDFTVTVGWAQGVPYLRCPQLNFTEPYHNTDTNTPYTPATEFHNGVISVLVVNSLSVPSTVDDDVFINVYVSACDDFELQEPNSGPLEGLIPVKNGNGTPAPPESPFSASSPTWEAWNAFGSDRLPPSATYPFDTGVLLTNDDTELYSASKFFTLSSVDTPEVDTPVSFTMHTDGAGGQPDNFTITVQVDTGTGLQPAGGANIDWGPLENGLYSATWNYLMPADTIEIRWTVNEPTLIGSRVIMDNVNMPVQDAWIDSRPSDWNGTPVTGAPFISEAYRQHWRLPTGSSLDLFPPVGNYGRIVALATAAGGELTFTTPESQTVSVISIPNVTVPVEVSSASIAELVTTKLQVSNTGTTTVRLYAISGTQAIPVQGMETDVMDVQTNMANTSEEQPRLCDVFFGETIGSIRQILKRYTLAHLLDTPEDSVVKVAYPTLPLGVAYAQLAGPRMSLWDWYIPAFVGYKGSMRVRTATNINNPCVTVITRLPDGAGTYVPQVSANFSLNDMTWSGATRGFGSEYTCAAEIPWYSNLRFLPARADPRSGFFEPEPAYQVSVRSENLRLPGDTKMEVMQAIGEDFSTYMFLCTPVITSA